jgi:hypothetical protein
MRRAPDEKAKMTRPRACTAIRLDQLFANGRSGFGGTKVAMRALARLANPVIQLQRPGACSLSSGESPSPYEHFPLSREAVTAFPSPIENSFLNWDAAVTTQCKNGDPKCVPPVVFRVVSVAESNRSPSHTHTVLATQSVGSIVP